MAVMQPRTVHVEHCMGTVFSIDIRDEGSWTAAIDAVVAWLHRVDAIFSTYKADSDISRIGRGHLVVADAQPEVAEVLDMCEQIAAETDGYFSAQFEGRLDPTGLVKGWAIEAASRLLRTYGSSNHSVNGGGDIQLAGEAAPGRPWGVGISDPNDRTRLLTVVTGRNLAVATSGTAERGSHILDPRSGAPASSLSSVTVVGRHLARADAYATAAFAMGPGALAWLERIPGHEGLVVDGTGEHETAGFRDLRQG